MNANDFEANDGSEFLSTGIPQGDRLDSDFIVSEPLAWIAYQERKRIEGSEVFDTPLSLDNCDEYIEALKNLYNRVSFLEGYKLRIAKVELISASEEYIGEKGETVEGRCLEISCLLPISLLGEDFDISVIKETLGTQRYLVNLVDDGSVKFKNLWEAIKSME